MATYSKQLLSGSAHGRPILISNTDSDPTNVIHTAHATDLDEIWLWAMNTHTADVKLSLEYGSDSDPGDLIEVTIPFESGLVLVMPGLLLTNSLTLEAFAATASVVSVMGFVNRITA